MVIYASNSLSLLSYSFIPDLNLLFLQIIPTAAFLFLLQD